MGLVPMSRGRPLDRAFEFRRATEALRLERLREEWDDAPWAGEARTPAFPDQAGAAARVAWLDLEGADLDQIVGECAVDHTLPPVPGTVGGSRAGYARWDAFRERALARYAAQRDDPLSGGVSRMSPYLHYGMVSPLRLAREAAAVPGPGAEKYLDELLVWRELAFGFCARRRDRDSVRAVPGWARDGLYPSRKAAGPAGTDQGAPRLPEDAALAAARTGDALWDAAQLSLVRHGELHNNVRMTWGKALVGWSRTAEEALRRLLEHNHRLALDGRDPASYGGLLWCLGQFDRPFQPIHPVFGPVRPRSTADHARRLDVGAYADAVTRCGTGRKLEVAVVGAGMAGLTAARALAAQGHAVTVFEKARGPGGRLSSKRLGGGATADHGAQYFTAGDPRFRAEVERWVTAGVVEPWRGTLAVLGAGGPTPVDDGRDRFVGVPRMSALTRFLADTSGAEVVLGCRIERMARRDGRWHLWAEGEAEPDPRGPFDVALVTTPSPQAVPLLEGPLQSAVASVRYAPCVAAVARCPQRVDVPFDGGLAPRDGGAPLSWVCRNSSKPGREGGETWVLHGSPTWSAQHIDGPAGDAAGDAALAVLFAAAWRDATGVALPAGTEWVVHRWRYSLPQTTLDGDAGFDAARALGSGGDAWGGAKVEGAYLSGAGLAGAVMRWAVAETRAATETSASAGPSEHP